jgi:hypothetical protein
MLANQIRTPSNSLMAPSGVRSVNALVRRCAGLPKCSDATTPLLKGCILDIHGVGRHRCCFAHSIDEDAMRIDANNQSDEWQFLVILTKSVDSKVQLMFRTDDKNVSADKKGLMSTVMDSCRV